MAYLQSPGYQIIEKGASAVTVGASTTVGGTVGVFQWGPVMVPMLIDSESTLVSVFGQPNDQTFGSFFTAANFLSYTNAMWVTRAATVNKNATANGAGLLIKNLADYEAAYSAGQGSVGAFAARYPGTLGNTILVSMADSATFSTWAYKDQFQSAPGTSDYAASKGGSADEVHIIVIDAAGKFSGTVGATLEKFAFVSKGSDAISYNGLANYYATVLMNQSQYVYWMGHPVGATNWGNSVIGTTFDTLIDDNTQTSLTITSCSVTANVATLNFTVQGSKPFVKGQSITVAGVTPTTYNGTFTVTGCTTSSVTYALVGSPTAGTVFGTVADAALNAGYDFSYTLAGGTDMNAPTDGELQLGWDLFKNMETYDISLFPTGNASTALAKYVSDNIAETRKDCVGFASMVTAAGGPIFGTSATVVADATTWKTAMGNSSYMFYDSGYKYMYDKYNDKYRWVALNADTAGLCAKVDANSDTWFSPAGITKGQIRGVIKLALNPTSAQRDELYKISINPVVTFTGLGTMLYGDKTGTTKPSAFDRINVRRLFLTLEKSIAKSARYQLFELNDAITRLQFVASVEPFLRDIQGRRGIEAFQVIADDTNNTAQIVSTNQFVGTILIKPRYSINFITLNFTAVGANVEFSVAATV